MDIREMLIKYKKIILIGILLSLLFIGLVIGWLNKGKKDTVTDIIANVDLEKNILPKGQFKYNRPELSNTVLSNTFSFENYPKERKLPVYEYSQNEIFSSDEKIVLFAKDLGFSDPRILNSSVQGKILTASTTKPYRHILIEVDLGRITINQSIETETSMKFTTNNTENQILESAKNYLEKFPIDISNFQFDSIEYLIKSDNSSEFATTLQYTSANLARIRYITKINEFDLITKNNSLKPNEIIITVDPNGIIHTVIIEPVGKPGEKLYDVPIISADKAIEKVKNPQEINLIDPEGLNPTVTPNSLYVNSARIAYIGLEGLLLPVLIIDGRVLVEKNKNPYVLPKELELKGYVDIIPKNESN